jgi:tetratricopeptide (TPR) repeat protein
MNDVTTRPHGQIITFYSYKGGTGRTMALANLACLLARSDPTHAPASSPRVLAIDWDFEAPGLHRYFERYLKSKPAESFQDAQGCLELFEQLYRERSTYNPSDYVANRQRAKLWFEGQDLEPYLLSTSFNDLCLMKAGRFDDTYPRRVSEFRWDNLFHATVGLFAGFADFLRTRFDYVLVDSRTGITDTSGICTMLLPDKLVVVFTPNQQSLTGIEALVRKAVAYRKGSPDGRSLTVFPLPSRVEMAKPELQDAWRTGSSGDPLIAARLPPGMSGYQPMFERLFSELYAGTVVHLEDYFKEVMLQHIPDYAYGEPIAVALETSDTRISLPRSYSDFRDRLIELDVPWSSLVAVRQEREILRRCDAIVRELMERSTGEAIKLSLALIELKPPEHLFERWTDTIFETARAAKGENRASASILVREWTRSAISESDIDSSMLGEALLIAGKLSQELGDLATATSLLDASVARLTDAFGAEHPKTLMAMDQLASAASAGRDFGKAHALNEKLLEVRRGVLGNGNLATLETMNNLAFGLFEQGNMAGARALLEQVSAEYQTSGDKDRDMLESMNNRAITLIDERDFQAARTLLEQLLATYRQALAGGQQADALTTTVELDASSAKGSGLPKGSGEPIAAVEIVKPPELTDASNLDFFFAPGYHAIDKMAARRIAVGDMRLEFPVIQKCRLDGMTLIWSTGRAWFNFSGDALELTRGQTLRIYPQWSGW